MKGFLVLRPQHMHAYVFSVYWFITIIDYTGLGSLLLQHLVPYYFLLSSSTLTQCLLNDSAEEPQVLSPSLKKLYCFIHKTTIIFPLSLTVYLSLT